MYKSSLTFFSQALFLLLSFVEELKDLGNVLIVP